MQINQRDDESQNIKNDDHLDIQNEDNVFHEQNYNQSEEMQSKESQQNKQSQNSNQELNPQNQEMCLVKKKVKKPLKVVEYAIKNIPGQNILINEEFFYCFGDIVLDFNKKYTDFDDRFSAWNICKMWPQTQIQRDIGIFSARLESRYLPEETNVNKQVNRYKQCTDITIHNLMSDIEKFLGYSKILNNYLKEYFINIKQNPMFTRQYYYRQMLFEKYMEPVYQQLTQEGVVFFASHSGPDIVTNYFTFSRIIFSESLAHILGQTLEELQEMYRRNGAYEFFDFESQIEVFKLMIYEQIHIFEQYNLNNYEVKRDKIPFKKQFRMATYDDIIFYTNVTFQIFKMSDFTRDTNNAVDFYSGVLYFEISPTTLKQIITIRQQNLEKKNLSLTNSLPFYQNSFEYTIQSEIFKEKFFDFKNQANNKDTQQNKTCSYKSIQ